jgi:phage shock protein PspC (stress-responsive transcriptional regulator)
MQKVITINLNGNAYQLEEDGYEALYQYLTAAERALAANPDRVEIMADLEQAIADKCQKFLGPHKSVAAAAEVAQVVKEMGPIETPSGDEEAGQSGAVADGAEAADAEPRVSRLYRIPSGAMIAGVCNGLSVYFGVDVAFIRIGFALAAILTKGAGILAYVVMMFIIPEAKTPEERAFAGGLPFNAKEVISRAKKHYAEGTRQWRRQLRQQQRHWRRTWPGAGAPFPYGPAPALMMLLPLLSLAHLALFVTMMVMLISLVNTGAILSWHLPVDVPLWAGVLILLVGYQIVVSPIRAAHHWPSQPEAAGPAQWVAFWNAVIWLVGLAVAVWIASDHVPEIREFLQRLPELGQGFVRSLSDLKAR